MTSFIDGIREREFPERALTGPEGMLARLHARGPRVCV